MTHTTDRELLELAAKAAGIAAVWREWATGRIDKLGCLKYTKKSGFRIGGRSWNPLTDDGDALRLGAALRLHILHNDPDDSVLWVSAVLNKRGFHGVVEFQDEVQRTGATRRAIVLAAAAIAKAGGES